jgi:hypothetical protein
MRTNLTKTFLILILAAVFASCGRMTSSVIPKTLNTDALILTAGHSQGITLVPDSHGEAWDSRFAETERRFSATITSGTSGQLLAAYRREVERTITSSGGAIFGTSIIGTANDVRDFSYAYTYGRNDGIVRVYSFAGTNNQVQIVLYCYEHSR